MTPTSHRAIVVKSTKVEDLVVETKPLPTLHDDEILVKVKAVTLNPTDWKHVHYGAVNPGASLGSDFAGDVVEVGKNAEGFKVGDAVAGYTRGGFIDPANGAFQEYFVADPKLVWRVPTDVLSYEDAASMGGIALSTAVQAFYHRLNLPTPWEPAKDALPILVWSGATSVGIYAIRLAKLSGLRVVTTASAKNHAFLKELGADAVFDYKDPEAPKKIREWSNGSLQYALDTISADGSTKLVAQAFGEKGGKVVTLQEITKEDLGEHGTNVDVVPILIYTALTKEENVAPGKVSDYDAIADWNQRVPQYAKDLKVMPLKHWEGGLEAIPEALAYLEAGKVSAQKISLTF